MNLKPEHLARLESFFDLVKSQTYPEPPSDLHTQITADALKFFFVEARLPSQPRVLDVGCGQGVAIEHFLKRNCLPIGITINPVDLQACREKGYDVREMDQSFLDFPDASFDVIWCRHCLEHSIFPYYTLHEFARVLAPGGYLYVEVPAPDTAAAHQTNPNHYSVLSKSAWTSLLVRSGYAIIKTADVSFTLQIGPDSYLSFIAQKPLKSA